MFSEQFRERLYTSKWEDKNIEFCKFHVVLDHQLRMDKSEQFRERIYTSRWEDKNIQFQKCL
ncbi:hypothetical protein J6590_094592 [Homalodisca vitripennis]|nr:hypothetical protein J6590_094592 [Homalodisca vitripennis]